MRFTPAGQPPPTLMAVDSMQVYRGMDIGSAKPNAEIRRALPYAMLDVADPWESYSAARFAAEAQTILDAHAHTHTHIGGHRRPIILVAGTILYLRALLEGLFAGPSADAAVRQRLQMEANAQGSAALHARLHGVDPVAAGRIHANDLRRIVRALEVYELTGQPISALQTQWQTEHPTMKCLCIGISRPTESLNRRINARVKTMLAAGLLDEVKRLRDAPGGLSVQAASGVGYRQLLDHLAGRLSFEEAVERMKIQTRHLAKLQRTWLKRFPNVRYIAAEDQQSGGDLIGAAMAILADAPNIF